MCPSPEFHPLDPWNVLETQGEWRLPGKIPTGEEVGALVDGIRGISTGVDGSGAETSVALGRALVLRRRIARLVEAEGNTVVIADGDHRQALAAALVLLAKVAGNLLDEISIGVQAARCVRLEFGLDEVAEDAGEENASGEPDESALTRAWSAYARAQSAARRGDAPGAAAMLKEALGEARPKSSGGGSDSKNAELEILTQWAALAARSDSTLIPGAECDQLIEIASSQTRPLEFAISLGHHVRAMHSFREQNWSDLVESARAANFHFYRFGGRQDARLAGVNTFLTAKGMYEQREWSEAGVLAALSLRALQSWAEWPTKGEAAMLMANARRYVGDRGGAREAVRRLIEEGEAQPTQSTVRNDILLAVLDEARELMAYLD